MTRPVLPGQPGAPLTPAIDPILPGGPTPHIGPGPVPYPDEGQPWPGDDPDFVEQNYGPPPENPVGVMDPAGVVRASEPKTFLVFFGSGNPWGVNEDELVPMLLVDRTVYVMPKDLRPGDVIPAGDGLRTVDRVRPAS